MHGQVTMHTVNILEPTQAWEDDKMLCTVCLPWGLQGCTGSIIWVYRIRLTTFYFENWLLPTDCKPVGSLLFHCFKCFNDCSSYLTLLKQEEKMHFLGTFLRAGLTQLVIISDSRILHVACILDYLNGTSVCHGLGFHWFSSSYFLFYVD